jgi:5-methyltetrahydrofolate--homocysteine methyltransferase
METMTANRFLEKLSLGQPLILDGATGTNLQGRGLEPGQPGEVWVMQRPDEIVRLHSDFISSGSDLILTSTFSGTSIRLAHYGLADQVEQVNRRAVELGRAAIAGRDVLLAGSIGPSGEMLQPMGTLDEATAAAAFNVQAQALAAVGVDLLVVETQFDLNEARLAVQAALATGLPVVVSFSYDRGKRTMMGVKPVQIAGQFSASGVAAIGINCGRSLDENLAALGELRAATTLPIWFKPNAGMPTTDESGRSYYSTTPEMMGELAPKWIEAGAALVGGCCGTSPEHLGAIAANIKN